ncbi:TniQ family protein [Bosea massiliensis]|uniref:TniQ family protein n=1 Tax=Bosea massiliensis TaxID=151419 RepID=A0ABW0PAZ3_9HYPH
MRINYVAVYPARQDGEPAYAHLMRVAQANGVKRVATLAANLGLESYRLHMRSSLETIGSVGRSDAVSLSHDTATDDRDIVTLRGETLKRGTQWSSLSVRRACPACYAEDKQATEPYKRRLPRAWHRTWWDVAAVTACPVHYCRLISVVSLLVV